MPDRQDELEKPADPELLSGADLLDDLPDDRGEETLPERRRVWPIRAVALLLALSLLFFAFGGLLRLLGLPPVGLLMASAQLTRDATVRSWTESVVAISAEERRGTGFLLEPGRLVITNQHIIEDASRITISFGAGDAQTASTWQSDEALDLVLITLDEEHSGGLPMETRRIPKPGDKLTLIGNPLGFFRIASEVEMIGLVQTSGWNQPLYAIRGAVYRGNSGSPVINEAGQVVGILFATVTSDNQDEGIIGLVIPSIAIQQVIDAAGD